MKLIVVFATHRSGTNYLGSVLKQRPHMFRLGELFHPQEAYGLRPAHLQRLGKLASQSFAKPNDPALLAWLHEHPVQAVQALHQMAERKEREAMYFKVFFSHFTTPVVGTVAKLAGLPGFTPVVLQRRPLDVFISNAKATQVGSWQKADTTDLRIKLSAKHYAEWAEKARRWYAQVNEGLKKAGATPWRTTYEQDVDMAPEALAAHWATHLGLAPPAKLDTSKVLERQDRNPDWRLKVSNAADFEQALQQAQLWDEAMAGFAVPR